MKWHEINEEEGRKYGLELLGFTQNGVILLVENDIVLLNESLASADADDRSSENCANGMSFLT